MVYVNVDLRLTRIRTEQIRHNLVEARAEGLTLATNVFLIGYFAPYCMYNTEAGALLVRRTLFGRLAIRSTNLAYLAYANASGAGCFTSGLRRKRRVPASM